MFSDSIDSKINKIKLNFDSYLNEKKKDNAPQPPVPSVRRPEMTSSGGIPIPSTNNLVQSSSAANPTTIPPVLQSKPL